MRRERPPLSHPKIIGIGNLRDRHGIHRLSNSLPTRFPNAEESHWDVEKFANGGNIPTCFKATEGEAGPVWTSLESVGSQTREFPPARVALS